MNKVCPVCDVVFTTKDSRQRSCGKSCADELRKQWRPDEPVAPIGVPLVVPTRSPVLDIDALPPVELLPAAYVKRCFDLWCSLIGDEEVMARIA